MMWFFAILVVLAMGGVGAGRRRQGAPLAEVYDDRPDCGRARAEGPLTAADLRRVRFSIALRGYRMSEVDALLDRLASEREQAEAVWGAPPGGRGDDRRRRAHFRPCRPEVIVYLVYLLTALATVVVVLTGCGWAGGGRSRHGPTSVGSWSTCTASRGSSRC